jgi:hypothetical protein
MSQYRVGDTVLVHGKRATVVWFCENPSEIEAMDEYIVEFEDKQRRFIVSAALHSKQRQALND